MSQNFCTQSLSLRLTGPVYVHIFIDVDAVTWNWAAAVDKIRTYIHTVCSHK